MKSEIDERGVITLTAETAVEAYALRHWSEWNLINVEDIKRMENCYWRGSGLLVKAEVSPS